MGKRNIVSADSVITPRQTRLLFAIIKEYCDTGVYIGSTELRDKYEFDFSPATIRNEFVKLRDSGYLYQPFVNSPSVPTQKAFKLFINQLIMGLTTASKQQAEMQQQISELQTKHENLNKEISRLVSEQTDSLSFSISEKGQGVTGMKHLIRGDEDMASTDNIIDLLENLETHKKLLLSNDQNDRKTKLNTVFGGDKNIFPISDGYAMITSEVMIGKEKTIFGIISPTKLLADPKKLEILNSLSKLLSEE